MLPIDPVHEGFNIWVHYGFTGLFVFCALLVVSYQTWQLKRSQDRYILLLETAITALTNSANSQKQMMTGLNEVKATVEKNTQASEKLLVYLKANDEARAKIRKTD